MVRLSPTPLPISFLVVPDLPSIFIDNSGLLLTIFFHPFIAHDHFILCIYIPFTHCIYVQLCFCYYRFCIFVATLHIQIVLLSRHFNFFLYLVLHSFAVNLLNSVVKWSENVYNVTDHGLDRGQPISWKGRNFSTPHTVQICSGANPFLYPMFTEAPAQRLEQPEPPFNADVHNALRFIPMCPTHILGAVLRHGNFYTFWITSWSKVPFQKMIIAQVVMKFRVFYGTQRFTTVFRRAREWTLSYAIWIQSISSYPIYLRLIFILPSNLHLSFVNCLFPSHFPTKILYVFAIV
jgi:hypothetical protein